ncbi:cysteine proteinase 1-like [Choristoneura fumiferana]|uniref:cysteine proteinase 1-like n=1 Tax=Choristoneura fumiferana TaxID=7141 RepID=UPI003D156AF9
MFLVVTLAAVYLATNVASAATVPQYEKVYYDLENADVLFKEYLKIHNKHYSAQEYPKRLETFKQSLREINIRNEVFSQTVFAPTVFSDLTQEERKSRFGFLPFNNTDAVILEVDPNAIYEDHFDWRDKGAVSAVKNQGACGSCYIFSAIGNIEGQYAIKHGQCLSLSEQQALDCLNTLGCNGGWPDDVMSQLAADNAALELESDYPYIASRGQCAEDASKKRVTVQDGKKLQTDDENALKQYLVTYGPLSIALDATDMQMYSGGVLHPSECENVMDHAVLLVGYGEEAGTPYWIIKNSWGTNWGEQGYVRMVRGIKACGITTYVATSTVA